MIYYDASESRKGSLLPQDCIDYGEAWTGFEEITGADFMIVPELSLADNVRVLKGKGKSITQIKNELKVTLKEVILASKKDNETILHEYLFSGCLLVQRKSGFDFVASLGERVNSSLARMCEVAQHQWQRIILSTGNFTAKGDMLKVNYKIANVKYTNFMGCVAMIYKRGGVYMNLPSDDFMLEWIKLQERQLLQAKRQDTKWIVPAVYYPHDEPGLDDPLQLPIRVTDGRLTLATFPGLGADKVNMLHSAIINDEGEWPNLWRMLQWATDYKTADKVKGWGKKQIEKNRQWLGLFDDCEMGQLPEYKKE